MSIDFNYFSLVFDDARVSRAIPGMLVASAPRSACRHRRGDLLAIYLDITGEHRYQADEISTLVRDAAGQFFQTQGSVTRAMLTACDQIHH
jgi:hypothetical protein